MSAPAFLTLKTTADAAQHWPAAIVAARGDVLAASSADDVRPLEPGTIHTGLIIARFAFAEDRDTFWASPDSASLAAADPALVALSCAGIAWEGWPGHSVPTIATVDVPDAGAPRAYMVIEGTGEDQARMDAYRDVILPMMRERGAYYVAFELGGDVRVLAGEWGEGIFAISRWPSLAHAEEFWFSDRYQNVAVPIRTGVGRFHVQIVEGLAG
ncbi:DUF1330 domain-containing protein [Sphingomonas sp. SUN019]|uniref:DUF1330 domain-containing protein n=1 Tax=Sphingomonas sp. SUN019 TaxID=2937788 RepID=UPI002164351D|nr:DUF1330 domain-containing protein [Sphingomonas sp. SUN019]UVO49676.1 DUF1330 domain-containing protein [Sphingomonas sp. SUN019]